MTSLTALALGDRALHQGGRISGGIPPELGRLTNLTSLELSGTQLTGVIPRELGNLAELETLILTSQVGWRGGLTEGIPPELGNLTRLKTLIIRSSRPDWTDPA